eukprot:1876878-Pyramimonas_sp.AAC.1
MWRLQTPVEKMANIRWHCRSSAAVWSHMYCTKPANFQFVESTRRKKASASMWNFCVWFGNPFT